VHKPKPYKCSICGAEIPDLPMPFYGISYRTSGVAPLRAIGQSSLARMVKAAASRTHRPRGLSALRAFGSLE
jgi:hypothetical protein